MKAVQIVRIGLPRMALRVGEVQRPVVGPGEIGIRVHAFGVNFADILARTGMYPDMPRLPFVPGFEVSGIVDEAGPDTPDSLKPGTRVAAITDFGAYAEFAVARAAFAVPIPGDMTFPEAAAIPINGTTAWLALSGLTSVHPGDRVLIHAAAGGVGIMAVQIALDAGCEVFGTCGSDVKAAFLKSVGVGHAFRHDTDVEALIERLTAGQRLDLVLDCLGGVSITSGLRMLAPSGRLVSIGTASMTPRNTRSLMSTGIGLLRAPILHPYSLLSEGKGFIGINLRRMMIERPDVVTRALRAVFDMVFSGRLKPFLDSTHPFEDCPGAHERIHSRRSIGKVVVLTGDQR